MALFFITGCSGVGKTTTAIALQKITDEYVIIDADWLWNIAWPQNDEEENDLIEQVYCVPGKSLLYRIGNSLLNNCTDYFVSNCIYFME